MTPEQFVYWLQGFNEIRDKEAAGLSQDQWDIIREHLQTVFHKVTPVTGSVQLPDILPNNSYPYTDPNSTGTPPNWGNPTIIC